jgi:hypothetical protein
MKPIEETNPQEGTPFKTLEDQNLRTYYRDAEKAFLDRFGQEHQDTVSPERLAWERTHPASLESCAEFAKAYTDAFGEKPTESIVGFYDMAERHAHIRAEANDDIVETLAHEHAHGLMAPEANDKLPHSVIEGAAEDYARRFAGFAPEAGDLAAYENEVRIVRSAEQLCGRGVVDKAVLEGKTEDLRAAVEHVLGKRQVST